MELKSFDTILTEICDSFDELISPKTITRSNTNVIYLVFKAIAKGFEVINNACVVLSNKFDPLYCSEDDLKSVASIVGTEKFSGSASGLHIIVTNNGQIDVTLKAGIYTYSFDSNTTFEFEVTEEREISAGSYISFIAMSKNIGRDSVTAQNDITVESAQPINENLKFSCTDNSSLLGTTEETDLEFRERIKFDTDRQNSLVELQNEIKNLPYIFDCKIKFNETNENIEYDGITIPPFTALIFYAGEVKNEIAEKIAEKIIFPTLQTVNSVPVKWENEIFSNGYFLAYITPFAKTQYSVEVIYRVNNAYINDFEAQVQIRTALFNTFVSEIHTDFIKEDDVYNVIKSLNFSGIDVLGVNLKYNGNNVNYIEVPISRIPELTAVDFIQG